MSPRYFSGLASQLGQVHALPHQTFAELVEATVASPVQLALTRPEMFALPDEEQNKRKRTDYLVPAVFKASPSPRQTSQATHCNVLFIDVDDGKESARILSVGPETLLGDLSAVVWRTARSTPEKPRLRVMVPVNGVPVPHYPAAVTALAGLLGMNAVTSESKVAVQPMYLPVQYLDSTESPIAYVKTDGQEFDHTQIAQIASLKGVEPMDPADADVGDISDIQYNVAVDETITLEIAGDMMQSLDASMGRDDWMRVAMGLRHQFPSETESKEAYKLFEKWSGTSPDKYMGDEDTETLWNSLEPEPKDREPVTISTLRSMAEKVGWCPLIKPNANSEWGNISLPRAVQPPKLDLNKAIPASLPDFRSFISATATAVQVDVDAVAPLALGIVSSAIARTYEIRLLPQWAETSVLWFAVLADPGERKSSLLGELAAPMHTWLSNEHQLLKTPLAAYSEQRESDKAQLTEIRKKLSKQPAISAAAAAALQATRQTLIQKTASEPELFHPQLVTADFTPEAARQLLINNGEKLCFISSETDFQQLTGSRYASKGQNGGQNLNLILSAKSGDKSASHRVGRSEVLDRPCMSIVIFVQPAAVNDMIKDSNTNGRGLVQRFAFIKPPSLVGDRINNPAAVPPYLKDWWNSKISGLLDLPWPGKVVLNQNIPIRNPSPPTVLKLSPAAEVIFNMLRQGLEDRLKENGDLRTIAGFVSKLPGEIARISLCLEVLRDPYATEVSDLTMQAACEWKHFLIEHHRAVLGDASEPIALRHVRRLAQVLRSEKTARITARDLFRKIQNQTDMKKMEEFKPVLDGLIEANCLRCIDHSNANSRGRPRSPSFEVNPAI